MIRLQPISTADTEHYTFMEKLLIAAFPPEEYRELSNLRNYTDQIGHFHNNLIFDDNTPVGFITYWNFERFYYVEHFAIHPDQRNGGYGQKVLQHICQQIKQPIVLEVEEPIEEMAQRRINFYKRQGFVLWDNEYQQPPYKAGDGFLPMHLMVYGNLQPEQDFEEVKQTLYSEVYNVVAD